MELVGHGVLLGDDGLKIFDIRSFLLIKVVQSKWLQFSLILQCVLFAKHRVVVSWAFVLLLVHPLHQVYLEVVDASGRTDRAV